MDVGTVLSVAQTLFAALQCSELREFCSVLGYQSQLDNLQQTVTTVKAVLQDAESKEEISHEAQLYIDSLKDSVYDADDLLDEFVTLAERNKNQLKEGDKISKKVHSFFSKFKDVGVAYRMSQGVKDIRKKLDSIADNHNKFGFKLDSQPIRKRREETCSYVYAQDIIGREGDQKKIVGMLLDSSAQRDVSFLTIVGMGGLGKTTLAQLVYNDERITREFSSRLWACVSDEDPKHLNVKAVLGKILGSTTGQKHDECTMDWLQGQVREQLAGKKYLLVLDDVWNEDRNAWLEMEKFFKGGQSGSWVVVTTRSRNTARIVGDGSSYELKGLSDEDSWLLFERTAFGQVEGQVNPRDLVEIGQEIVKKCANVPLAIRVAGSLLYGQAKDKWLSFQAIGLAGVRRGENGILSILKLSYYNLESQLKSCFSYCALFPKDYEIQKEMLISLWMAQGFIVPFDEGQSIEDAGEEYFLILLRRCFFQDVKKDEYGEIISCKIHDLMLDIAQEVAGGEVSAVSFITSNLDKKIRHLSVESTSIDGTLTKVRTFIHFEKKIQLPVSILLVNWICLRTLNLAGVDIKHLPDSIGKLLHLRYLDLSRNYVMKALPKSVTKLYNLQTLILRDCRGLIELVNDISKLVKLRFLDTMGCNGLNYMPWGMGKLSCLQKLTMFAVDVGNSDCVNQLEGLKALTKLKGRLEMNIRNSTNGKYVKGNGSDGGYLMNKPHLSEIQFRFADEESGEEVDYEEALMEDLQAHHNLGRLEIWYYNGARMPSWAREDNLATFLPNLVRIHLFKCHGLRYLPPLGKLRQLRSLEINGLSNVELWELPKLEGADEFSFFPSLEEVELMNLPKLKVWWREIGMGDESSSSRLPHHLFPSFPRLSKLMIYSCPELTSIPLCPNLEELQLENFNERLRIMDEKGGHTYCYPSSSKSRDHGNTKLRKVVTDNVKVLKSVLPLKAFQCLTDLIITYDRNLERLVQVGELFQSCSSSLRLLIIRNCSKLRSVSGGMEHLTALETLEIYYCPNLTLNLKEAEEEEDDGMPWRALHQSLRALKLHDLPKLVKLPEGMQHLTSLQSFDISDCKELKSLPEWMWNLTSLTQLRVKGCSRDLMQRCRSPCGQDWPNIQHITHLSFSVIPLAWMVDQIASTFISVIKETKGDR